MPMRLRHYYDAGAYESSLGHPLAADVARAAAEPSVWVLPLWP